MVGKISGASVLTVGASVGGTHQRAQEGSGDESREESSEVTAHQERGLWIE